MEQFMNYTMMPTNTSVGNATLPDEKPMPVQKIYDEYEMSIEMYPIHTILFVSLGLIGNLIAFIVTLRKSQRGTTTAIFIWTLAISDSIALFGFLLGMVPFTYHPESITHSYCKAYFFILSTGAMMSSWTIVSMTFERTFFVVYPLVTHKIAQYNTERKGIIIVSTSLLVIAVWMVLQNIHFFWTGVASPGACSYSDKLHHKEFLRHWSVYDACIGAYIPLGSIFVMNITIIILMRVNKTAIENGSPKKKKKWSATTQVTVMLLTVSIAFFLLVTPYAVFQIYFMYILDLSKIKDQYQHMAEIALANQFCTMFWEINHSINVVLYSVTRRSFRRELVNMCKEFKNWIMKTLCSKDIKEQKSYDLTQAANINGIAYINGTVTVTAFQSEETITVY